MIWVLALTAIYDVALVACCAFVWRFGERLERLALVICVGASVLTAMLYFARGAVGPAIRYAYLLTDIAVLVAFDSIMCRSRRFWPIWATGAQLATVLLGLAMAVSPQTYAQYRMIQGKFAYVVLLSLVLGAWPRRS